MEAWLVVLLVSGLNVAVVVGGTLAFFAILLLGLMLLSAKLKAQRASERALRERGLPATATVRSVAHDVLLGRNNRGSMIPMQLTLDVHLPDGRSYQVYLRKFLWIVQLPRVQPGCRLEVRYDPADLSRVAILL